MGKKIKVLVTDDEPQVLAVLAALIQALGEEYTTYLASNAAGALQILNHTRIDFAFLDVNMAEINGLELLNRIRQRHPDVLVVIITGQPSYSVVLEAWRHQAADFISKPFALEELKTVLAKLKKKKFGPEEKLKIVPSAPDQKLIQGLHAQIAKMTREQSILCTICENLGNLRYSEDIYSMILQMALDLTGAHQASFMMFDRENDRLELINNLGTDKVSPGFWEAARQVVRKQAPVFIKGEKNGDSNPEMVKTGLALPFKVRGELFGTLIVSGKPSQGFNSEDLVVLNLLAERSALTVENLALYESMALNLYDSLRALVNSLEARDPYSSRHSERVTQTALWFAQKLGLPQEELDSIRVAGYLHDIGKIGIRDAILLKPDKLTPEERTIIQTHPLIGAKIVEPMGLLPREKTIILHHHERWDGRGYPFGLAEDQIPFLSRILALADTYDALTSARPYRRRCSKKEALQEIRANTGSQFDPELARRFVTMMEGAPLSPQVSLDKGSKTPPRRIFDSLGEITGSPPKV